MEAFENGGPRKTICPQYQEERIGKDRRDDCNKKGVMFTNRSERPWAYRMPDGGYIVAGGSIGRISWPEARRGYSVSPRRVWSGYTSTADR